MFYEWFWIYQARDELEWDLERGTRQDSYSQVTMVRMAGRPLTVPAFSSSSSSLTQFLCVALAAWNSLCRPGWPWTHRDPIASVSQVLGLKVCATTAWYPVFFCVVYGSSSWVNELLLPKQRSRSSFLPRQILVGRAQRKCPVARSQPAARACLQQPAAGVA